MTRVDDFEHGSFQVVCIATPHGARWASAAMLMSLKSIEFDDRPRWFSWDLDDADAALRHAAVCARRLIESGSAAARPGAGR